MPIADMPQSNKQHAVPQNFMDVEFKLIGDLTMRQFSYLMIFGILAYISASTIIGIFKWPFTIVFILLGLGLAFVPVEERGMDDWVVSFIKAINTPTQRIWKKEPEIPSALTYENIDVVKQEMITLAPTSSRRKLEEYLRYQSGEVEKDPLDIPEKEYIMKVREAFYYEPGQEKTPAGGASGVSVAVEEETEEWLPPGMEAGEKGPSEAGGEVTEEKQTGVTAEETEKEKENGKAEESAKEAGTQTTQDAAEKVVSVEKKETAQQNQLKHEHKVLEKKEPKFLLVASALKSKTDPDSIPSPMTPDTHSGRKFSNLLPSSGELVLPIRGERVLRTSDQAEIDESIEEKTEKLEQLLTQIRVKEGMPAQKKQVQTTEKTQTAKTDKEKAGSMYAVNQPQKTVSAASQNQNPDETAQAFITQEKIYPLTQQPDVLSGIVKDSKGEILPNTLVIIRNSKDEAVRAFKTNSMGQFVLLTPMDKGSYKVEISKSNNLPETFDIISVDVKGEVIPPIIFKGK